MRSAGLVGTAGHFAGALSRALEPPFRQLLRWQIAGASDFAKCQAPWLALPPCRPADHRNFYVPTQAHGTSTELPC